MHFSIFFEHFFWSSIDMEMDMGTYLHGKDRDFGMPLGSQWDMDDTWCWDIA